MPVALLLLTPLVFACVSISTQVVKTVDAPVPSCISAPASWHDIFPGRSTYADVLSILGDPLRTVTTTSNRRLQILRFDYPPGANTVAGPFDNNVMFNDDGTVGKMNIWITRTMESQHTIGEYVQKYGSTLDTFYGYGTYYAGAPAHLPEEEAMVVYVWSSCGIAVVAENTASSGDASSPSGEFDILHPVATETRKPNSDDIVMREWIFQPTSLEEFLKARFGIVTIAHPGLIIN